MVIMGRSRNYEPETCESALRAALARAGNRAGAQELFEQVKKQGHWNDANIWQEMISHTINMPASCHYYGMVKQAQRFLFLREDGNYEMYDQNWHGRYEMGKRVV
jgi:hypothetical protein